MNIHRAPWGSFPNLTVHAMTAAVRGHRAFQAASAGDEQAANEVVGSFFSRKNLDQASTSGIEFVVPLIRAQFDSGVSALPLALARTTAETLGARLHTGINQVSSYPIPAPASITRLTNQPIFTGEAPKGVCLIVSDFVTYGSSIANLRGFLHKQGATVSAACSLTAEYTASRLAPDPSIIHAIHSRFGAEVKLLEEKVGFSPQMLTHREALFIYGLRNFNSLRDPLVPTHAFFSAAPF